MRKQSTRAEMTPWRFDNEYHWGDFRGNVAEMLRRGYDIHFRYANFGIRSLHIRLPRGLPDLRAARPYLGKDGLGYVKDTSGAGATLVIDPNHEPGDLDELYDPDRVIDRLIPLRSEILAGDLRPLYLGHLAVCRDINHDPDDTVEGPVPAGLVELTPAQQALAKLYEIRKPLLATAAEASPPLPPQPKRDTRVGEWLACQPEAIKNRWLAELLSDGHSAARATILAKYRESLSVPAWPVIRRDRAISQLLEGAARRRRAAKHRAAAKAEDKHRQQLASIAADPQPTLRQVDRLIAKRQTAAYEEAAQLLVDVRDALAASGRDHVAATRAAALKAKHPTLRCLAAALRRRALL
jgi:hypothetical protein